MFRRRVFISPNWFFSMTKATIFVYTLIHTFPELQV